MAEIQITDEIRRQVRSDAARDAVNARWSRLTREERIAQMAPPRRVARLLSYQRRTRPPPRTILAGDWSVARSPRTQAHTSASDSSR